MENKKQDNKKENAQLVGQKLTLLTGKPYVNASKTDVVQTFKSLGWVPPSEARQSCADR